MITTNYSCRIRRRSRAGGRANASPASDTAWHAVAGVHGAVRVRTGRSGGVNQEDARAARAAGQTDRRPRAWPLARKLFMPPASGAVSTGCFRGLRL
jgi:hypothetical protein